MSLQFGFINFVTLAPSLRYVTIPMAPTVDSLNTGIAGSVMLYELRRKMIEQLKAGKPVEEAVCSQ